MMSDEISSTRHGTCQPRFLKLDRKSDDRGDLVISEFSALPFFPKRFFVQSVSAKDTSRGNHAHKRCEQILVPISGRVDVDVLYCGGTASFELEKKDFGLYLPAYTWSVQKNFSVNAKVLVLASEPYDEADYVRDLIEFTELLKDHT
jgi:hypothetical protein